MVGVTISLSNDQPFQTNYQQRLIKIKPIEQKKNSHKDIDSNLSMNKENSLVYSEVENVRMELNQLQEQREQMLQSTIQEIKAKKENWEDEKKIYIEQAYEDGFQKGFQQGEKEGEEQYTKKIEQINRLVDTTTKDYHKIIEQSDQVIVDLSIHTAEKIIKEKLEEQPNRYLNIVTAAVQEIKDQSIISIFSHPNNYELLVKQKKELMNAVNGDTDISIYIDKNMTENECLIKHQFGQIDASIDTQLEKIRESLYQVGTEKKL